VNKATLNPQPVDAAISPRFSAIPTFMRLPYLTEPTKVDIALIGVPWDGGTTNRAGARHGPREIRNMSSFMRKVHHVSRIAPYELACIADLGDAPVNPIDLLDTLGRVERFYQTVHAAGAIPLSAGGDHLITLPIFRAIAKDRPVGMVHFDAHSDTNDRYFGDNKYTHGTPFRRAIEEGVLDPERTIQIGIRGSIYGAGDMEFASTSGDVRVKLPANLDADVRMSTTSGGLKTDFPLTIEEPERGHGRRAAGRVGGGSRNLRLSSTSGSVSLLMM